MIFYKCLKDKAMNIEINQYSYLSPKNNNKQKETILRRQHLKWFSCFIATSLLFLCSIRMVLNTQPLNTSVEHLYSIECLIL